MLKLLSINNLKTYIIVFAVITAVWFFKDYRYQKSENQRQTQNTTQLRKYDSLLYASQTYTKQELNEYLEYNRKDLKLFLEENKINTKNIQQIISQELKYHDFNTQTTTLQPIKNAIKDERDLKIPFTDSTECLVIKGMVVFENDTLTLDITDRKFNNASDVVSFIERKQWKFGPIKSRLFGKKTTTVIIKDACGETKTLVIDKK